MLRRKITKSEQSSEEDVNLKLKRKIVSEDVVDNKYEENNYNKEDNNLNVDIGEWIVNNIITKDIIDRLKSNILIAIPNVDSNSTEIEWLNMLFKSYFSKEDIKNILENINKNNEKLEDYQKLKLRYEQLEEQINDLTKSYEEQKNKNFKLKQKMEQMVKLSKLIEISFDDIVGSQKIQSLLDEAIKADTDNLSDFVIPFVLHTREIFLLKSNLTDNEENNMKVYLNKVKDLLKSISGKYIPQRKVLLEEIANSISNNFENIKFVSPEEYTFVDTKIHNIPPMGGQKVVEGISFAVVKKETNQTMIYADIKAQ